MASEDEVDYKALFLQAEERATREREQRQQAEKRQQEAEKRQQEAETRATQEREQRLKAEERQQEAEELNQPTSFNEFIQSCHNLLSLSIRVQHPAFSTKGSIGKPVGKLYPVYLRHWTDCSNTQDRFYRDVLSYFQPSERLFPPKIELEGIARRCRRRLLSSEADLGFHEQLAVEQHVQDIITALCRKPEARVSFTLGEGVMFENHTNIIEEDNDNISVIDGRRSIPDQFCIHRRENGILRLLTTVEYKPPHKLPVEYLRTGLRPMNLWKEVIKRDPPKDEEAKLIYNAEQITASVLVQEFDVMIREGLEYSYITNGLAYILLRIDRDDPTTLYYHLCEPNMEISPEETQILQPKTSIARVLCLCLMSCTSQPRDQNWRNQWIEKLDTWETSLDYERSQIPDEELRRTPPGSEYIPSSPVSSPPMAGDRPITRSRASCTPQSLTGLTDSDSGPNSDSEQPTPGRKRNLSELTASPPNRRQSRQREDGRSQGNHRQHTEAFCTQKCLLGLHRGGNLDEGCPNVESHRSRNGSDKHPIDAEHLVGLINQQLDKDLDQNCTPFGKCGSYGAPFKITCHQYGYTVVGKGTTSRRWGEVQREAVVYRFLHRAQGSAVPVFLGCVNLRMTYYLHGAGPIKHMLLMGWGGEDTSTIEGSQKLDSEIKRSEKEIRTMGVNHLDLKPNNILWNAELGRALIIDFHRSRLIVSPRHRISKKRLAALDGVEDGRKRTGKRGKVF
ncbi:hypothetical protein McanMca71_000776 [Microsporum canis]|uniref:Protein kinase domain-containing protein n=1 Tax=Arthroderma otae (strain ATCC MYA-4605 / CBS 113480) TaxID=554155 RepID=C5FLE6_ARTOC|nr:conserved hypothetical protein [Microsporum canis CBS 113480]EEQ30518.1 conserved hypothetical protein [Microsporum canis CBS 113480]